MTFASGCLDYHGWNKSRAGINVPTRMYDLRHLYATTMLTNGADLAAVSTLMGHSTITMTADTYYQYIVVAAIT
jgi:site-specific recombinase XerD